MSRPRPNVLLIMTDQQRGDCLGIEGHPVLQTPYLDEIGGTGFHCRRAYSACPVCVPARRTLMTGQRPVTHKVLCNYGTDLAGETLPGVLGREGYQTHLVGKLHLHPPRKLYGFHSADWADGPGSMLAMSDRYLPGGAAGQRLSDENDYVRFLLDRGITQPIASRAHGMNGNGYPARPWHLDENLHMNTWSADCAIRFLERRDPTMPFFLKLSFFYPHTPCTPPRFYWDMYNDLGLAGLPEPAVGDWVDEADVCRGPGAPVIWQRRPLAGLQRQQYMAGYFGLITHIDHQVGRVLSVMPANTIVLFTSDHGEMMGDHHYMRKSQPYEGSARVPWVMRFPESMGLTQGRKIDDAVELMDVMPTLLDAVGAPIPATVEGRSLMPLLRDPAAEWRPYVHGETAHTGVYQTQPWTGMHYLTDGKRKYIWFPGRGREQLFDLTGDPHECHDLIADPTWADELATWRARLVDELRDRPEGFVRDNQLVDLGGPTPIFIGAE